MAETSANIFYTTPAAFINGYPFMASVPFAYQPNMPQSLKTGMGRTIVNYQDPNNRQNMYITISQMLDLTDAGFDFYLHVPEDIYKVFQTIDEYLLGVRREIAARSMPHIIYAKKLVDFREDNFTAFHMACLANDGIMTEVLDYYGKSDAFSQIFERDTYADDITLPKAERVRNALKRIRRPPIDVTTLEIEPPKVEITDTDPLEHFFKDDLPGVEENYIERLYGQKE